MNKQHYLVKETNYFFDGHGEEAKGATKVYISQNDLFASIDPEAFYNGGGEICGTFTDGGSELHEQDGYHCTATAYDARPILEQDVKATQSLIDTYNAL